MLVALGEAELLPGTPQFSLFLVLPTVKESGNNPITGRSGKPVTGSMGMEFILLQSLETACHAVSVIYNRQSKGVHFLFSFPLDIYNISKYSQTL